MKMKEIRLSETLTTKKAVLRLVKDSRNIIVVNAEGLMDEIIGLQEVDTARKETKKKAQHIGDEFTCTACGKTAKLEVGCSLVYAAVRHGEEEKVIDEIGYACKSCTKRWEEGEEYGLLQSVRRGD